MKKLFIAIFIICLIIAGLVFYYRYTILQYSAETFIKNILPDYAKIDKIEFNAKDREIIFLGFRILNPYDFSYRYLLEIDEISCRYKMKGKSIIDGFEVLEPSFSGAVLNIERLGDGRINLDEMKKLMSQAPIGTGEGAPTAKSNDARSEKKLDRANAQGKRPLSEIIKLPETFGIKNGKVIFIDRFVATKPHMLTFESINANLSLKLNDSYTEVFGMTSTGQGKVNGREDEVVKWTISLDPTTPKLTMSNRFEVSGVDIIPFEPYYDKYSPFVFKKGRFSGMLIFDFDNGTIGSTNEVRLSGILFYIKHGYENAQFWETSVQDLAKYFTSSYGDLIFDFKIKGDMSNPKFYLGPISKQAIARLAIDKISQVIEGISQPKEGGSGPKSDLEKAKEYIDLFRGLIEKK